MIVENCNHALAASGYRCTNRAGGNGSAPDPGWENLPCSPDPLTGFRRGKGKGRATEGKRNGMLGRGRK